MCIVAPGRGGLCGVKENASFGTEWSLLPGTHNTSLKMGVM